MAEAPSAHRLDAHPPRWLSLAPFLLLAIWAAQRLGAFTLWTTIAVDGVAERLPNGYVTVDHPFHAARAETLLRSLAAGDVLRWIGSHQGGYPAEFYPLGAAALDVAGWFVAFGSQPMAVVHKLVVIAIFLAPGIGFALIGRAAGFPPTAALVAFAGHLCVRGDWWSGGSQELIEWGLVSNVTAATALLVTIGLFLNADGRWTWRWVGCAGAVGGFALVTNPRTALVLLPLAIGVAFAAVLDGGRDELRRWLMRLGVLLAIAGALAAPVIIALARFRNLYTFVHYTGYEDLGAYFDASIQAVGAPLFWCGLAGIAAGLAGVGGRTMRVVSLTAALYVVMTAAFVLEWVPQSLISQLELTRLMPMQRLLWLMAAGHAVVALVGVLARRRSRAMWWQWAGGVAVAGLIAVLYVASPPSFIPAGDHGLRVPPVGAEAGLADLETAVRAADGVAPAGTTVLVIGTLNRPMQWHDQLWSPLWSERRFLYNDWLWMWQQKQRRADAADPRIGNAYREPAMALAPEFLTAHGVGAIVVTGEAAVAAAMEPHLHLTRGGTWSVYVVRGSGGIATSDGATLRVERFDDQAIVIRGQTTGAPVVIHHNWFPRWTGRINGETVPVMETADGQIRIDAPAGEVEIELRYETDWLDWFARLLVFAGIIALGVLMMRPARVAPAA